MNWIDLLIYIIVAFCIWGGWRKGFIGSALELVLWIGSLLISFFLYKYMASIIEIVIKNLGVWLYPLAFVLSVVIHTLNFFSTNL